MYRHAFLGLFQYAFCIVVANDSAARARDTASPHLNQCIEIFLRSVAASLTATVCSGSLLSLLRRALALLHEDRSNHYLPGLRSCLQVCRSLLANKNAIMSYASFVVS